MKYQNLDEDAKERAREWYRRGFDHDEWWDCIYDDAAICLGFLGFDVTTQTRTKSGHYVPKQNISFSGFGSHGDGASFTGTWRACRVDPAKLTDHAPKDATLRAICAELSVLALRHPDAGVSIGTDSANYVHARAMEWRECQLSDENDEDDEDECRALAEAVETQARYAADWIYAQLEREYDWLTSDEAVEEGITANDYDFDEDGGIA